MPNHITNVIKVKELGETSLTDIHKRLLNDNRMVDFNVMLAMPECLKDFEPHSRILSVASVKIGLPLDKNPLISMLEASNRARDFEDFEQMSVEDKEAVEKAIKNFNECGYMYWYDWSCDNWGTKWNAYSQPESGFDENATEFRFETAWSHPAELVRKTSEYLPNVTFDILYADEDTGSNCGSYTLKNGFILAQDIAPPWRDQTEHEKKKFSKFAFTLCNPGTDPRSYGYDENWQYSDEIADKYEEEQKIT